MWLRIGQQFYGGNEHQESAEKMNIEAEVEHSDLSSATPGAADIFVMAKDIAASASVPADQLVVISNIIDINELETKLHAYFTAHSII